MQNSREKSMKALIRKQRAAAIHTCPEDLLSAYYVSGGPGDTTVAKPGMMSVLMSLRVYQGRQT